MALSVNKSNYLFNNLSKKIKTEKITDNTISVFDFEALLKQQPKQNIQDLVKKTKSQKPVFMLLMNEAKEYLKQTNKEFIDINNFFIRMRAYGRNEFWARKMSQLSCVVSMMINKNEDFDKIMEVIQNGVLNINKAPNSSYCLYGIRRTTNFHIFSFGENLRGAEYYEKYLKKAGKHQFSVSANDEYKKANIASVFINKSFKDDGTYQITVRNPQSSGVNLELAKHAYEKLKNIKNPTIKDINDTCATIQWLIAHEGPYSKGNDSVANILTKSIYHAYDIKISPIKEATSLDFEAFYRDLDDYIQKYPDFFEYKPEKLK